jgi:site-specific DNA-methyltransferase (adenine-specific)
VKPYYQDGSVTIYHGDCREVLPTVEYKCTLTDPPYGLGFRGEAWDAKIPDIESWLPFVRTAGTTVVITAPTTMWDYPRPDWVLCWTRPGSTSRTAYGAFNHWSPCLVYGRGRWNPDSKRIPSIQQQVENRGIFHPSPKPQELMRWLVLGTEGVVLDPFAGSGTTLRAAKDLGRKAIGIEIDERYCEIAAERCRQETLQLVAP